jgi:pimeloyl-ACP methyl ester carboxylesterase
MPLYFTDSATAEDAVVFLRALGTTGSIRSTEWHIGPPPAATRTLWSSEMSAGYRALDPDGVQRWQAVRAAAHREQEITSGSEPRTPTTKARLAGFTTPTLLLGGAVDLLTPPHSIS